MPTPRVIAILDPARLLERAVEGLFPLAAASDANPWPTLPAWIVLRQGGLRDDLHTLAARRGVPGWFDAPICLFNELADRWGGDEPLAPLSEPERQAILSGLVERHGGTIFRRGASPEAWVGALDRLIGELIGEGVTPDDLERALHVAASDPFSAARADVLSRIYVEWHATLARARRADGRDGKIHLATAIARDPAGFTARLGGRRDVRIVGLADLRGGWRALIAALAASPALDRLELLTTFRLPLDPALVADYSECEPDDAPEAALLRTNASAPRDVRLVEAPDAAREMELIAVRVRALLDAGVAPSRVAVVARQARPLVHEVSSALTRLGVPITARRRTGLAHTAPARALRAILGLVTDGWSRHAMI